MSTFQIAGYDKRTELLAIKHELPAERTTEARSLARMRSEDDGYGCYPLDAAAVHQIGNWLNGPLRFDLYDWFLEPRVI